MVLVPLCLHTLRGNKLKAILPLGQERQPFQAPQSAWKGPPQKATWVESRHAQLLGNDAGCVVRNACATFPQSSGLGTAIPRGAVSQMPSVSWLLSLLLCVLWAGGANKTPQALSRSLSADTGGLWIRPPMVCSKSDADIFKLQRWKCWKT